MIVEFYKDTEEAIFIKKIKNNHVGQLMKKTQGKANPKLLNDILIKKLN